MEYTYSSLHNHSDYSNLKLIDAVNTVDNLIQYAHDIGLKGIAITDHDCVSGHVKALEYYDNHFDDEQKKNFKLILGNEIYLCRNDLTAETHQKGEKFYHLILLAKDKIGHDQIREISSRAWSRSYFKNLMRTPTYSQDLYEIIEQNPNHIICSTACLGSYTGYMFQQGNYAAIEQYLENMQSLFGENNFYIEIQPSFTDDQINYNKYMLINYWGKYKFICTTDSHYLTKKDREIHKTFLNSKEGDREVDAFYSSSYMMTYAELKEYFESYISEEKIIEMCNNTNNICNSIEYYTLKHPQIVPKIKYELNQEQMDKVADFITSVTYNYLKKENNYFVKMYDYSDGSISSGDMYLMYLIIEGFNKIPKNFIDTEEKALKYIERLNYELEQIYEISIQIKQSLSDYFITMTKNIDIMWNEGDSLVGPARGSAAGFLINYLIGITQINPMEQPIDMMPWRFMHKSRPGLPDIDVDSESTKRKKIFNKIQEYFRSIGGDVINICTFGTEGSKSALRTAARGLDIDDDLISYVTAMIPNERGFDLTLDQCYYGDDDHQPIKAFKEEMDKNVELWKSAKGIEGIITRLGIHASGVLEVNDVITKYNSVMKTSKGMLVTAYNLEDSESMGGLKYDFLTVQALDKIRVCMNLLLEDQEIEWQGSLRETYNKYAHPDVIQYTHKGMWDSLYKGEIVSAFQFDTMVGSQAVKLIHPQSIMELAIGNSVMRLMAGDGQELPLETYVKQKNDISIWYNEMKQYGLNQDEIETLEKHLLPLSGLADSQEIAMLLVMDNKIAGLDLTDANMLRKAIAKKSAKALEKAIKIYYEAGNKLGTRQIMLDYVWNVQIGRQLGYSFSNLHTIAYSHIALQEMNLSYFYPSIYWKTACLSVDAGAINEEDYYNLVEEGIINLTDDDDKKEQNKVQYGKIASAISKFKEYINIELPDINVARFGFTPDAERNSIVFGLKGIARVGDQIINDIIIRRPFISLNDFIDKMVDSGKKLISKDKIVNLIKSGAFDKVEKKPREEILKDFILSVADQKKKLNLMNFQMLIKYDMIPSDLSFSVKVYNFTKYIRKMRFMGNYILDENGYEFYSENYDLSKVKILEDNGLNVNVINEKYWDLIYDKEMDKPRNYIKQHHDELLDRLNSLLFKEEYDKYATGDILQWELDSLSFYHSGHPLSTISLPCDITSVKSLVENEFDGFWMIKGKKIPKYKLNTIIGTVIDKDKTKGIITLSTPDGVIDVKIYKQQFAKYAHTISEVDEDGNKNILEDSFFDKGTHLVITGVLKGNTFVPKVYKDTGFEPVLKIILKDDGSVDYLLKKS